MRIDSSDLTLHSEHNLVESQQKSETLRIWVNNGQPSNNPEPNTVLNLTEGEITDVISFSERAKDFLRMERSIVQGRSESDDPYELKLEEKDQRAIRLIECFIESLTGKKVKLNIPEIRLHRTNSESQAIPQKEAIPQDEGLGWGAVYHFHEAEYENETLSFSAFGKIKTQDGREFNVDFKLDMSRTYYYQRDIDIRLGNAKKIDPLVINFGDGPLTLTQKKYNFDLDSDGKDDSISFTGVGSGFLALDLNSDGIINDGSELFGPQSGDGFQDLSKYDADNNLWIDENDPIFEKLCIWAKNDQGEDYLLALGKVGIGAIYLGHLSSPFAFKDGNNNLQGEMRQSGIYLRENGSVGSIHHIDLAV